jgi:hypothetical protein
MQRSSKKRGWCKNRAIPLEAAAELWSLNNLLGSGVCVRRIYEMLDLPIY